MSLRTSPGSLFSNIIFLISGIFCALVFLQGTQSLFGNSRETPSREIVSFSNGHSSPLLKRALPNATRCECSNATKNGSKDSETEVEYREVTLQGGNLTLSLPRNDAILRDLDYAELNILCETQGINGEIIKGVRCCPKTAPTRFFHKYPSKRPNATREALFINLLRDVTTNLHAANIPFFIMGGTLLGWRRECGIITHTTDLDIGIFEEDWDTQKIHNVMTVASNLNFSSCTSFDGYGWEITYRTKTKYRIWANKRLEEGIKIDIRQMMREKEYSWMGAGQTQSNRHQRWPGHAYIVPADFRGIPVGIVNDVDSYLAHEYNDFWTLQEKFLWDTSQHNLAHGIPRWNATFPNIRNSPLCRIENGGFSLAPLPPLKGAKKPT